MLTNDEIVRYIRNDMGSERKRKARLGERYYNGHHDIERYRLFYYDADGNLVEDRTRSNIKIPHQFFTELVDQQAQYMLSGRGDKIRSDDPTVQEILNDRFNRNEDFKAALYDLVEDTIKNGFGYLYAYVDSDGRLQFESADAMGVAEVRADEASDRCEYVITYDPVPTRDGRSRQVWKVGVWDKTRCWRYVWDGGAGLRLDPDADPNPRPHVLYTDGGNDGSLYWQDLGVIPFFRLDNNARQESGIVRVKKLIDDYDLMSSGLSNNIQDASDAFWVVRGYDGNDLDMLIDNIRRKKQVAVGSEGDVEIKTVAIPVEARKAKLEEDRRDIYEFGMGLDPDKVGDGNVTNVVIMSRYALLDLKCNKLETRLKQFLNRIVQLVLDEHNREAGTGYDTGMVWYDFERNVISNETDKAAIRLSEAQAQQTRINTLLAVADRLGKDLLVEQICGALDIDYAEVKDRLPDQDDPEEDLDDAMEEIGDDEGAAPGGAETTA